MGIKLFNTLSRRKEEFKPLKEGHVSMYHCGPTAYDHAHIGNLRSFVFADTLRRVFAYNGYEVKQIMNITDVDDKTIKRSREKNISLKKLTEEHADMFLKDLEILNILKPTALPRATDHIDDMVALIGTLLQKGFAYKSADGSVYFKISVCKDYGVLAGLQGVELNLGARVSQY